MRLLTLITCALLASSAFGHEEEINYSSGYCTSLYSQQDPKNALFTIIGSRIFTTGARGTVINGMEHEFFEPKNRYQVLEGFDWGGTFKLSKYVEFAGSKKEGNRYSYYVESSIHALKLESQQVRCFQHDFEAP